MPRPSKNYQEVIARDGGAPFWVNAALFVGLLLTYFVTLKKSGSRDWALAAIAGYGAIWYFLECIWPTPKCKIDDEIHEEKELAKSPQPEEKAD